MKVRVCLAVCKLNLWILLRKAAHEKLVIICLKKINLKKAAWLDLNKKNKMTGSSSSRLEEEDKIDISSQRWETASLHTQSTLYLSAENLSTAKNKAAVVAFAVEYHTSRSDCKLQASFFEVPLSLVRDHHPPFCLWKVQLQLNFDFLSFSRIFQYYYYYLAVINSPQFILLC